MRCVALRGLRECGWRSGQARAAALGELSPRPALRSASPAAARACRASTFPRSTSPTTIHGDGQCRSRHDLVNPRAAEESVYSSGGSYQGQVARTTLPPPDYTPSPRPILRPPRRTARASRAQRMREASRRMARARCATTSRSPVCTSRSARAIRCRCCRGATACRSRPSWAPTICSDGRLHIGQELVIPGAQGSAKQSRARPRSARADRRDLQGAEGRHAALASPTKLGVSEKAADRAQQAPRRTVCTSVRCWRAGQDAPMSPPMAQGGQSPRARPSLKSHVVKTTTITAPGAASSPQGSPGRALRSPRKKTIRRTRRKAKGKPDHKTKPANGEAAASPEVTGEGQRPRREPTSSCRRRIRCPATASAGR